MSEYKAKANILFDGAIYKIGETLSLTDADAAQIARYIEKVEAPAVKQPQKQDVNYKELTINELKELVEKRELNVEATGKNGHPVKADYIKALEG